MILHRNRVAMLRPEMEEAAPGRAASQQGQLADWRKPTAGGGGQHERF
jgi:hypothetical protein